MSEDNRTDSGAPSADTTSALFVSARKRQLEQQETERRDREKEEQRLAAEAEVRRLEREVAERRRKAEEDTRRVAAETKARMGQTAAYPYAPPPPAMPGAGAAAPKAKTSNKKLLAIIGGAAAVVVLAVALVIVLSGGGPAGGSDGAPVGGPASGIPSPTADPAGTSDPAGDAPEPPTADPVSYGMYGWYFLNGDPDGEGYFFDTDGTMEIWLPEGGGVVGEYAEDGDIIYVTYRGTTLTLTLLEDGDTLMNEAGDVYIREGAPDPNDSVSEDTPTPVVISADAPLDAMAAWGDLNAAVYYPSSVFYADNDEADYVRLYSLYEGYTGITIHSGVKVPDTYLVAEDFEPYAQSIMDELTDGAWDVVKEDMRVVGLQPDGGFSYVEHSVTFTIGDYVMNGYVRSGIWTNTHTGQLYMTHYTVYAPVDTFHIYMALFNRIYDTMASS